MPELERYPWEEREPRSGKFRKSVACDCCGKPCGSNYFTDDEVCGSTDDPGFFLCERARCIKQRAGLNVEERRVLYRAARGTR